MKCCICHRESFSGHLIDGVAAGVYTCPPVARGERPVHPSCVARLRKTRKRRLKAVQKAARAPRWTTVRRPTVHMFARAQPPVACGPDGVRRVDQHHAHTKDPRQVTCPLCKRTAAFAVAVARADEAERVRDERTAQEV